MSYKDTISPLKNTVSCPSLDTNEQVWNLRSGVKKEKSVRDLARKRAKMVRKSIIASQLIDYGKKVNSPNLPEYWAVFKCGTQLNQSKNTYLTQKSYCGSRLCPNCSNVRTRKVLDELLPLIDLSKDWAMLTLTNSNNEIENCPEKLKIRLEKEALFLKKCKDNYRKKNDCVDACISLEIVPPGYKYKKENGERYFSRSFHPHYHILIDKKFAIYLKEKWLEEYPTALPINQKLVSIKNDTKSIEKSIVEVVKYSLKACLPADSKKGQYSCLNVKGIDEIISIMKGKKRLKLWGCFYDRKNGVDKIENSKIEDLDIKKVSYCDLPVKDEGDFVKSYDWKGNELIDCPSFVKDVVYTWDFKRQNYFYLDEFKNEIKLIPDDNFHLIKIMVCEDKKIIKYVNSKNCDYEKV